MCQCRGWSISFPESHVFENFDSQLTISGQCTHRLGSSVRNWKNNEKHGYLKQSRAINLVASAEHARQLLQSTTADSIRIRYLSLSTFLFLFFQTISDDLPQFLSGKNLNGLPGVLGLGCFRQSGPLERLLNKIKIDPPVSTWTASSFVCLCQRRMMVST
jgi:hypothetical protein